MKFSEQTKTRALIVAIILLVITALCMSKPASAAQLYTEESQIGESIDTFVLRIAPRAVLKTKIHSAELCGAIRMQGARYVLTLHSSMDRNECRIPQSEYADAVSIFHTHVPVSGNNNFGPGDYSHPGYLAVGSRVLHQSGRGTERRVN